MRSSPIRNVVSASDRAFHRRRWPLFAFVICAVCTLIGSAGLALAAPGDEAPGTGASGSTQASLTANAERVADNNTMEGYKSALLSDEWGARYAGRIWSDKSVVAATSGSEPASIALTSADDGIDQTITGTSDFLHVVSLLGSYQVIQQDGVATVDNINDAGVSNSITYADPIGKYMEVKGVDGLVLFGKYYGTHLHGIYDYAFNNAWMKAHNPEGQGVASFVTGWYSSNNPQSAEKLENGSWEAGNYYFLGWKDAVEEVPTLSNVDDDGEPITTPDQLSEKQKNTIFDIYDFVNADGTEDTETIENPSFGENGFPNVGKVSFPLDDVSVWSEYTGNYLDSGAGDYLKDGFDEALYLNVPYQALPIQVATVTLGADGNPTNYETSLGTSGSFPLRLFYSVGVSDSVLYEGTNSVDTGLLSTEYLAENTVDGNVRLWSNYYTTPTSSGIENPSTPGDAAMTFSPYSTNRYYVFQKNLPVYVAENDTTGAYQNWKVVGADPSKTFSDTLEVANPENPEETVTLTAVGSETILSDHWYYLPLEYYAPGEGSNEGTGQFCQIAIARQGMNFSSGGNNETGNDYAYLCWWNPTTGAVENNFVAGVPEGEGWIVATKVGGLRTGMLSRQIKPKDPNITQSASTSYYPTISQTTSGDASDIVINTYLGNNGLLTTSDNEVLVTNKMSAYGDTDMTLDYQLFVDGLSGTRDAIMVRYDRWSGLWRQRISTIEALTTNEGFLIEAGTTNPVVVKNEEDGKDYYYYVGTGPDNSFLLYDAPENNNPELDTGGMTTYVRPEDLESASANNTSNHVYRAATEEFPVGTIGFWASDVWMVPVDEVGENWTFNDGHVHPHADIQVAALILAPDEGLRSDVTLTSPYSITGTYLTQSVTFGAQAEGAEAYDTQDLFDPNGFDLPARNGIVQSFEADELPANTAQFEIEDGWGLLVSGIPENAAFRATQQISAQERGTGVALTKARAVQTSNYLEYTVGSTYDSTPLTYGEQTTQNVPGYAIESGYWSFVNGEGGAITDITPLDTEPYNVASFGPNLATAPAQSNSYYSIFGDASSYEKAAQFENIGGAVPVYRLVNDLNGAHLLTASWNEVQHLDGNGGWRYEFLSFYGAKPGSDNTVKVTRLYNPNNGDHIYSTQRTEIDALLNIGWKEEANQFAGVISSIHPIYRLWNSQMTGNGGLGSHLWTPDAREYRVLPTLNPVGAWKQEGQGSRIWFATGVPGLQQ